MLTAERLREVLDYNPATGIFQWRSRPETHHRLRIWNARYAGRPAGSIDAYGYVVIGVDGRAYKAHRLAWLYVHGEWPRLETDHRDRCRTNNAIENLRLATDAQNAWNASHRLDNRSGVVGVSWYKGTGKWHAQINRNGKRCSLGYFRDKGTAAAAYAAAARAERGNFTPEALR